MDLTVLTKYKFSHEYIDESSATNSNFIANMKTAESTPRGIFTLNNHILFRVNHTTFSVMQSE